MDKIDTMDKMEKMKEEVNGKLKYWGRMCALFSILLASNCWNYFRPIPGSDNFTDFFEGFQLGCACTFMIFAVYRTVSFLRILQDEEAIRTWYIKEHDERTAAIWAKSGGTALYTCGILIIGAAIIAGYFNPTVFITLLLCGVSLLVIKKGLLLYYRKTI